jgi:hypothetical protein
MAKKGIKNFVIQSDELSHKNMKMLSAILNATQAEILKMLIAFYVHNCSNASTLATIINISEDVETLSGQS